MKVQLMTLNNDEYTIHPRMVTEQEAYENLANAIILQAVNDWRTGNHTTQETAERFFRSDWFLLLTKMDPEFLIEKLKEEEANERNEEATKGTKTNSCGATRESNLQAG